MKRDRATTETGQGENGDAELPGTRNVSIWFVFSIEYSSLLSKGTIGQEHGRTHEVVVSGVPASEFIDGMPNGSVLETAEREFIVKARSLVKPNEDIFRWEARLGSADGKLLSRFELYHR